ncbi:MAG: ATP-binding protein [Ruminococcus sp.]|nr:ATP-binding protein [Ruminococcus sp.]
MENHDVRLEEITVQKFKNVQYGKLSFIPNKKGISSEIIGLYGQNGSGKTALVEALAILKSLLCGKKLNNKFADFIKVGEENSVLTFIFKIAERDSNKLTRVEYSFCMGKIQDVQEDNYNDIYIEEKPYDFRPIIRWEKISFQTIIKGKVIKKMKPYIDTSDDSFPFKPNTKYNLLIGGNKSIHNELISIKRYVSLMSRSFAFSKEFLNILRKNCSKSDFMDIYESLIYYGNFRLFIFDTDVNAMLKLNILPISFNFKNGSSKANGNIGIPINGNGCIPVETYNLAENLIENMNVVLKEIVPNLTISIRKIGEELSRNNQIMYRVQLLSNKNGRPIPLCYESEGIKKIFSILQLLINVYNQYSFTVAIDELDSGIFEYLLGELLSIISNKGKGQLIFTSHNLRPLETLDKSCIAFTTTNPENRYIRPTYVKTTNNLRDYYYRDIVLGEQDEDVYDTTNNSEIAFSFREAGDFCGS